MANYDNPNSNKPKSFWSKPEGKTGAFFLIAMVALAGWLLVSFGAALAGIFASLIGKIAILGTIGVILYMFLDGRTRNLFSYMYQSVMRKITSIFVTIDPMGILKNYISDLEGNLKKMGKQIGNLKGQMRNLKTQVTTNNADIEKNLAIARKAKQLGNEKQMVLSSRKAARLKETNGKYVALHKKLSVLYRVLTKMYSNSEILLEDTKDQVRVKEQERKAIRASHSAMKSAMSIIKGDPDKRAMFDQAMQGIADDVANKVGEMERFMELSSDFMNSIDLQEGIFEEKGMRMLEEYEQKSTLLLLGGSEENTETLDLNEPRKEVQYRTNKDDNSDYSNLFD
jgi:phage shock protein A